MSKKKNDIYDVSAELVREFGAVGSREREKAIAEAWEHICTDFAQGPKQAKSPLDLLAKGT